MEGYQLWMAVSQYPKQLHKLNNLAQLQFVKSALAVNPCVVIFYLKVCYLENICNFVCKQLYYLE